MNKIEKAFLFCVVGAPFPLCGFLAGWWVTCQFLKEWQVALAALSGLIAGLAVDVRYLKSWVSKAYQGSWLLWPGLFLFYSICIFGFFMGVPVFNLILVLPAGFYVGCRLAENQAPDALARRFERHTQFMTTGILALICVTSATLALRDPTTAANLEGMLKLKFAVTQPMILGLILLGGTGLLAANWVLTGKTLELTRRWKMR